MSNDLHLYGVKRTCGDQLTDVIFCQRPPGHEGAHMHQWRETDPISMWGRAMDSAVSWPIPEADRATHAAQRLQASAFQYAKLVGPAQ